MSSGKVGSAVQRSKIAILGWSTPAFRKDEPSEWLGNDPVLGRLTCPPLTRLNLQKGASEPLIFNRVQTSHEGAETVWTLGLRTGIFWWSGRELNSGDVVRFLKRNLPALLERKGVSLKPVPEFKILEVPHEIKVVWQKDPVVEPFIFNGVPLWQESQRQDSDFKFECVGRFIPKTDGRGFTLTSNPRYQNEAQEFLFQEHPTSTVRGGSGFEFTMADEQPLALNR